MENEGIYIKNKLRSLGLEMNIIADMLKMSRQNLNYHLRKQNVDDGFKEKLQVIFPNHFTNVNIGGVKNEVITESDKNSNRFIPIAGGQYIMLVPLVEDYAYAGYLSGYTDAEFLNELPKHPIIVDYFHKGRYFAFRVVGDSMRNELSEDSIKPGSIATGREIQPHLLNGRLHMHKFQDYIIVHQEGVLLKRIIYHDVDTGDIICHSLNPDKGAYPDFTLNLKDIRQLLNVVNVSQPR